MNILKHIAVGIVMLTGCVLLGLTIIWGAALAYAVGEAHGCIAGIAWGIVAFGVVVGIFTGAAERG